MLIGWYTGLWGEEEEGPAGTGQERLEGAGVSQEGGQSLNAPGGGPVWAEIIFRPESCTF